MNFTSDAKLPRQNVVTVSDPEVKGVKPHNEEPTEEKTDDSSVLSHVNSEPADKKSEDNE